MKRGQLIKKFNITGAIIAKTGLHIGGTNLGLSIGGIDNTVVRNPLTKEPYIPGSSLKGKMRSLLEKVEGKFTTSKLLNAGPYTEDFKDDICQLFGITPDDIKKKVEKDLGKDKYDPKLHDEPISRLIVRDSFLDKESANRLLNTKSTDVPFTEVKTEVVIDRITAAATPRPLERVPAGAIFNFSIILNLYSGDELKEKDFLNRIYECLLLLQNDYLGGSGTRGSGEVEIYIKKIEYKNKKIYEEQNDWAEDIENEIPRLLHESNKDFNKVSINEN